MKKPHILITNDDGIEAQGIRHLYSALKDFATLTIVAPASEQSGVGLSISFRTSLKVNSVPWDDESPAWSVTGTPADCVKIAIGVILKTPPDLIVSGINRGTNSGRSLLYSGTVGGVIEGAFRGIPGIAFSSYDMEDTEYQAFEKYIPKIVESVMTHPLPSGTILNVNFPPCKRELNRQSSPYGIKLTRQGKQYWIGCPETKGENNTYQLQSKITDYIEHDESDVYWLERGFITAAPVHVDELTDWRYLHAKKELFEQLFPV